MHFLRREYTAPSLADLAHGWAITTKTCIAPGNNRAVFQDCSKCSICCPNLLAHSSADLGLPSCQLSPPAPSNNSIAPTFAVSWSPSWSPAWSVCIASAVTSLEKPCPNDSKRLLGQSLKVPYFGGLWNGRALTTTTGQSHSELNRVFRCFPEISALHGMPTNLGSSIERRKKTPSRASQRANVRI